LSVRQSPQLVLKTRLAGDDTTIVSTAGELDFATRDDLTGLLASIEELGTATLVLDMRELSFIDSAGLHVLVSAHRRALTGGWTFQIICAPGPVWRALTLSGLTNELNFISRVPGEN
jgi:anti-sigma B factor antagonist